MALASTSLRRSCHDNVMTLKVVGGERRLSNQLKRRRERAESEIKGKEWESDVRVEYKGQRKV